MEGLNVLGMREGHEEGVGKEAETEHYRVNIGSSNSVLQTVLIV